MTIVVQGLVGARLTEARKARGISATDLADMVGVSVQSISKYENEWQSPKLNVLHSIADKLNFPSDYFLRPIPAADPHPVFWRARMTASPIARDRAGVRLEWMKEIIDYIAGYFDLPRLNVPKLEMPTDGFVDSDFVERAAKSIREHWGIRSGPMPDVVEHLESNGILVSRIHVRAEKLDAFSQWSDRFGLPFIMLSRDKASACRQRFDALHELVHVTLHSSLTERRLNDRAYYKEIEKQADRIASAILMPADTFTEELYAPSLDSFLTLKERWGTSVGAMIMRCSSLDILDEESCRRLWINYNRRNWRNGEPLDDKIEKEEPQLIRRSFEMLIDEDVQSAAEIMKALPFPAADLEELADLESGTLTGEASSRAVPVLKDEFRHDQKVVSLFGRRS